MDANEKINQPLSAEELKALDELLWKGNHLSVFELHGVLCGFLSSSGTLPMEVCLAGVLGKNMSRNSNDEMKQIGYLIARLEKQIAMELMNELFFPMVDYEGIANFSAKNLNELQRRHLSFWCCGYVYAIGLDAARWMVQGLQEEFLMFLRPLFMLSKEILIWVGIEEETGNEIEKQLKNQTIDGISKLIPAIYAVWHDRSGRLKNHPMNVSNFDQYAYSSDEELEEYCQLRGSVH